MDISALFRQIEQLQNRQGLQLRTGDKLDLLVRQVRARMELSVMIRGEQFNARTEVPLEPGRYRAEVTSTSPQMRLRLLPPPQSSSTSTGSSPATGRTTQLQGVLSQPGMGRSTSLQSSPNQLIIPARGGGNLDLMAPHRLNLRPLLQTQRPAAIGTAATPSMPRAAGVSPSSSPITAAPTNPPPNTAPTAPGGSAGSQTPAQTTNASIATTTRVPAPARAPAQAGAPTTATTARTPVSPAPAAPPPATSAPSSAAEPAPLPRTLSPPVASNPRAPAGASTAQQVSAAQQSDIRRTHGMTSSQPQGPRSEAGQAQTVPTSSPRPPAQQPGINRPLGTPLTANAPAPTAATQQHMGTSSAPAPQSAERPATMPANRSAAPQSPGQNSDTPASPPRAGSTPAPVPSAQSPLAGARISAPQAGTGTSPLTGSPTPAPGSPQSGTSTPATAATSTASERNLQQAPSSQPNASTAPLSAAAAKRTPATAPLTAARGQSQPIGAPVQQGTPTASPAPASGSQGPQASAQTASPAPSSSTAVPVSGTPASPPSPGATRIAQPPQQLQAPGAESAGQQQPAASADRLTTPGRPVAQSAPSAAPTPTVPKSAVQAAPPAGTGNAPAPAPPPPASTTQGPAAISGLSSPNTGGISGSAPAPPATAQANLSQARSILQILPLVSGESAPVQSAAPPAATQQPQATAGRELSGAAAKASAQLAARNSESRQLAQQLQQLLQQSGLFFESRMLQQGNPPKDDLKYKLLIMFSRLSRDSDVRDQLRSRLDNLTRDQLSNLLRQEEGALVMEMPLEDDPLLKRLSIRMQKRRREKNPGESDILSLYVDFQQLGPVRINLMQTARGIDASLLVEHLPSLEPLEAARTEISQLASEASQKDVRLHVRPSPETSAREFDNQLRLLQFLHGESPTNS